jgi:hypothetical protein
MLGVLGVVNALAAIFQPEPTGGGGDNIPNPTPDPSGVPGESAIATMLNVLSWLGVAGCVAAVIVGGGIMAVSHASANGMWGSRGRTVVLSGLAGGLIVALAGQLVRFMVGLGGE